MTSKMTCKEITLLIIANESKRKTELGLRFNISFKDKDENVHYIRQRE